MRAVILLLLLSALSANSAIVTGTVKDPSGAGIAGASVSAQPARGTALQTTTDSAGRFRIDPAPAGAYRVSVSKDGFDPWQHTVTVAEKPVDLQVSLKLKILTTTVQVSGRRSPLANSDPNYTALRGGRLIKVYRVQNLVLQRDVGTFDFRSGSFSFLPPVLGHVTVGVFVGDGNFRMKPASDYAVEHLQRIAGMDQVNEDFTALVVYFSDSTFDEVKQHSEIVDESPERHEAALQRVKDILERRMEPGSPMMGSDAASLTLLQRLFNYEDIPNYEAEILAELYNPAQRGSFRAFLNGKKHAGLRFLLNPAGALPMIRAPEEVALLNFDPPSPNDGIWYLSHLAAELRSRTASSREDKRLVAPEHYNIDVFIRPANLVGKEPDMAVTCTLQFRSLTAGTRMVKFDLFPDLQVSRVTWNDKEIPFVQESRKHDGSFYLQMPVALEKDRTYEVGFEYSGGDILESTDGQPVPPRRVWYPTPAGFGNRATFDLKYHIPGNTTLVSVGKLMGDAHEGGFHVFEYKSEMAIEQATFRYLGQEAYSRSTTEQTTHTHLAVYVIGGPGTGGRAEAPPPGPQSSGGGGSTAPLPRLGESSGGGFNFEAVRAGLQPSSTGDVLIDAGNAERVLHAWFGPPAYDSLSVLEAPGVTASLAGVVYADPHTLAGYQANQPATMRTVMDEAFARQVALQWWGNTVAPATFHDDWLATGFADFSAAVYDLTAKPAEFVEHWQRARENLLLPSPRGPIYNQTGPMWMGLLNATFHAPGAGGVLANSKGGFVLHMLRCMMWDAKSGDADFRAMMRDFVHQFANRTVTTEDFQKVVEQHMKPAMDLDKNHTMDWFFNDWVYGTDVPSYSLEYSLAPGENGKTVLSGKLKQSGVSEAFAMPVPVFAAFGLKNVRVGVIPIHGNTTAEFKVILPDQPQRAFLNLESDVLTEREEVRQIQQPGAGR